jgi:outer membrane protein insertion porin family
MYYQGIAQLRIGKMQFEGNERFSDQNLSEWCEISPGMNWNPILLQGANKKLLQALQSEGYLFARVDSVAVSDDGDEKIISLTWYIHEGKPFYLGNITIEADSLAPFDIENRMESKTGDIYWEDQIESDLLYINRFCAVYGFPFANIEIRKSNIRQSDSYYEIDLNLKVTEGQRIYINNIILQGNTITQEKVVLRELDISVGDVYNQDLIDIIPEKLNRLGYFKNVKPPRLITLDSTHTALLIEIDEGNTTTFDGVLGYVPPDKDITTQEGYFTGSIQLSLRNLFGTGRKFEVDWRKPDRFSDEFRVYYEEPWVLNYPVNIGIGLERIVRDTTYIDRLYYLNSKLRITGSWGGTFRLIQKSSIPDSTASRDLRLTNNTVLSGELGIEYDSRDYPRNPREGVFYFTSFSYGLKEITGPTYLIEQDSLVKKEELQKIQLGLSYYLNLWKNQVFAVKIFAGTINGSEDQLQLTDHFWFGGARTLRGYRENQFHGTTILWANLEYRFLIGRDSRIFIFNDWGFYNYDDSLGKQQDILPGYGLGIRFNTPLGIMGIDFGFGRGDSFSKGKIHFGVVNTF